MPERLLPPNVKPSFVQEVQVDMGGGHLEEMLVDPALGPWIYLPDGSMGLFVLRPIPQGIGYYHKGSYHDRDRRYCPKTWPEMTSTEQKVSLHMAAKKNRALREWKGNNYWDAAKVRLKEEPGAIQEDSALNEEVTKAVQESIRERCDLELSRTTPMWIPITIDTVTANHERRAPGMFFGFEFPWTEEMLAEFGPAWLTLAFHAAGSLEKSNRVVKIKMEEKVKVTTGNNGGKFLFEVEYATPEPGLHRHLFAKVPFPLSGATKSDRLSSSVNKQPQEFWEINTYRLLEATLPVKTPRFYYGDISNETSNWILITERVPFADHEGTNFGKPSRAKRQPLKPFAIEGPYDKCLDHNLRGIEKDYYLLLVRTGAKMAGMHKAGLLCSDEVLVANFGCPRADPKFAVAWGVDPDRATGEAPSNVARKLETAIRFISDTGKVLFPTYAAEEAFQEKLTTTMLTICAYSAEISYWKHMDPDYTALAHTNLNVDNAYFWRDASGRLDCGVFDWGAMGSGSLGHKLWWWLYCGDYEPFRKYLRTYLKTFNETYQEHGGPALDVGVLETMVILTALEQMMGLVSAVPQIMKMCPAKEWPTIKDRYDPRISENVDGKSTLRLYLHVMNTVIRIIEEMQGDKVLQNWIQDIWVGQLGQKAKSDAVIRGG